MTDDQTVFYNVEKQKFYELLNKLHWTEDHLLKEQETLIQCSIEPGHRFPIGSKHVEKCQLKKEGFSKEYLKELAECEKEKQLFNQSSISFTPSTLSNILHRPIAITNIDKNRLDMLQRTIAIENICCFLSQDLPLSTEQTTILFSPSERSLIAQAVYDEALSLGIVPSTSHSNFDNQTTMLREPNISQQSNKSVELRDQKRRRPKYVTRTTNRDFYDIARDMIDTGMKFIEQINHQSNSNQSELDKDKKKHKKHKHRSSSRKKRRSSRSHSRKRHQDSKKRRR
ncbi:unnamed protein product, partial [Rotaria socialis]